MQKMFIEIDGNKYPIKGDLSHPAPVVIIGMGTLLYESLSLNLREQLPFIVSDLYWLKDSALKKPEELTIDLAAAHIDAMLKQLNINHATLMAHSAFGLLALHAALNSQRVANVILVATPPVSNPILGAYADKYFQEHASPARQAVDREFQADVEKREKAGEALPFVEKYIGRTARFFSRYTIEPSVQREMWRNSTPDEKTMTHFFATLLPSHDTEAHTRLTKPVCLLAGEKDYDCLPLISWDEFGHKPIHFDIIEIPDTGHWPQWENSECFDSELCRWRGRSCP